MTTDVRAANWLDRLEEAFMAIALAFMTVLTFVQVILRYFFHSSLVWSLEATTYTFGGLIAIGMAYGVRTHAHIAVDLLTRRLGPGAQRTVAVLAFAVSLVYCVLMLYASAIYVEGLVDLGHRAQDIPLPRWLLASILPVGFALLGWRIVEAGWRYFAPAGAGSGAGAAAGPGTDGQGGSQR